MSSWRNLATKKVFSDQYCIFLQNYLCLNKF